MMAISDLGETLIIHGFNTKMILLMMQLLLMISLTTLKVIGVSIFSWRYEILIIYIVLNSLEI